MDVCKFGDAKHEYKTVHAATVQAFTIGTLLTMLPIIRQNGFDMAFIVINRNIHYTVYTRVVNS